MSSKLSFPLAPRLQEQTRITFLVCHHYMHISSVSFRVAADFAVRLSLFLYQISNHHRHKTRHPNLPIIITVLSFIV
jgi:hypothetical protein